MHTITNHEELIQYVTAEGWKNISPTCYRYTLENESFYLTLYINPFRKERIDIFLTTPRGTENDSGFYGEEDEDLHAMKILQYQLKKLQKKYEKWQQNQSKTSVLEVFKQRGATYNEEIGCYELQFENGKQLYLFTLPNGYRYELSVSQNLEQTSWSHHIYEEDSCDVKQFQRHLSTIESCIPFLDGWVQEISQDNYQKDSNYGRCFHIKGAPYHEKANRLKDILFQYVSQDALYHVIPAIYNHDEENEKNYLELEFYKKREYLSSIEKSVVEEMQSLVKEFDFLHYKEGYKYHLYYIVLKEIEEEQFIPFARKLGEKINALL